MTFEEVIRILTTSHCYCILLIPMIFLIVSSERYLHLSPPSLIQAMSHDQISLWKYDCMKLCNRKFPSAIQLKIILCTDFQADGEFQAWWYMRNENASPIQSDPESNQIRSLIGSEQSNLGYMLMASHLVCLSEQQPVAGNLFCFIVGNFEKNWAFLTAILCKVYFWNNLYHSSFG